ncbi:hypothetical protein GCK32_008578 [Trichostrongylus colubriformis]|uniref:Uncharacterized protein n=1 Tax=Trichostrongylus colubriformis TaxID=6319 RepID=A0AAN8G1Z2_TRICO
MVGMVSFIHLPSGGRRATVEIRLFRRTKRVKWFR